MTSYDPTTPEGRREQLLHDMATTRYGSAYSDYPHDHPISRTIRENCEPYADVALTHLDWLQRQVDAVRAAIDHYRDDVTAEQIRRALDGDPS